jgi:predicted nucleic acid-binding protein
VRLVDTSFWIALLLPRDRNHGDAHSLWRSETGPLLCTEHVAGETWTFLRRRAGHRQAVAFLDALEGSPRVVRFHVEPAIEAEAFEWLRRHDEREYSWVDSVSFAVMRRQRLNEALAFDDDFAAAGFVEVRPA